MKCYHNAIIPSPKESNLLTQTMATMSQRWSADEVSGLITKRDAVDAMSWLFSTLCTVNGLLLTW